MVTQYNELAATPDIAFIKVWMQVVFPAPLGPRAIIPCLTRWVSNSWMTFSFQGGWLTKPASSTWNITKPHTGWHPQWSRLNRCLKYTHKGQRKKKWRAKVYWVSWTIFFTVLKVINMTFYILPHENIYYTKQYGYKISSQANKKHLPVSLGLNTFILTFYWKSI